MNISLTPALLTSSRRRLTKAGYTQFTGDVNALDYSEVIRTDLLMPDGSREVWTMPRPAGWGEGGKGDE